MLARKFLHYQQDRPKITGEEEEEELTGPAPPSLFLLAACMVKVRGEGQGCLSVEACVLPGGRRVKIYRKYIGMGTWEHGTACVFVFVCLRGGIRGAGEGSGPLPVACSNDCIVCQYIYIKRLYRVSIYIYICADHPFQYIYIYIHVGMGDQHRGDKVCDQVIPAGMTSSFSASCRPQSHSADLSRDRPATIFNTVTVTVFFY